MEAQIKCTQLCEAGSNSLVKSETKPSTSLHLLLFPKKVRCSFLLFALCRSSENQITMHKCFFFLVFMVIILPSLGLSRYRPPCYAALPAHKLPGSHPGPLPWQSSPKGLRSHCHRKHSLAVLSYSHMVTNGNLPHRGVEQSSLPGCHS